MNPYKKVFNALAKEQINYLVVGGVAVNLYGYNRFTADIDILIALDEENLKKLEHIMKRMGYVQRLPVELHELRDKQKVKKWIKDKGMTAYTFISDKKPQLDIDILVGYSFDFKNFYNRRETIKIWGISVPVISMDDLIKMKRKANRDQDLIDLKALLELKSS